MGIRNCDFFSEFDAAGGYKLMSEEKVSSGGKREYAVVAGDSSNSFTEIRKYRRVQYETELAGTIGSFLLVAVFRNRERFLTSDDHHRHCRGLFGR